MSRARHRSLGPRAPVRTASRRSRATPKRDVLLAIIVGAALISCTHGADEAAPSSVIGTEAPDGHELPIRVGIPVNLGPGVNLTGFDGGPSVSANGLQLYFVSDRSGGLGCGDIWMARRTSRSEPFAAAENLGSVVNSPACEGAPSLSNDGRFLYFECFEPDPRVHCHDPDLGDDLWVAHRDDPTQPFQTVVNLGRAINSVQSEGFPNISGDGLTLYFSSTRLGGSGDADLWRSTRTNTSTDFGPPENLGDLNSPTYDGEPAMTADGLRLVFASDRPGGYGDHDLWMASRPSIDAPFGSPVNLGAEINTPGLEGRPAFSRDDTILYFMSDRPGGAGSVDMWQAAIGTSVASVTPASTARVASGRRSSAHRR